MFGKRLTLFKLFGFEVRLDASWLIIAALVVWSLAVGVFPLWYPGLAIGTYWWMGIAGAVGLFGSIIVHELFHSLVARRYGLPMRGITLFVFGGIAEMEQEPQSAKAEFAMAIAGPLASVGIGFVFYVLAVAGRGVWPAPVAGVVAYLAWINWILAAFNMIPAFPLDGGRVLRAAIWHYKGNQRRATQIASGVGSAFGLVLMALGVLQLFTGSFIGAVWWFLIGMFIRAASQMSYQQVVMRSVLEGEPLRRFMNAHPITVPPDTTVQDLVENYIYRYHHRMHPVVDSSQTLIGCVTTEQVKTVPRNQWGERRVQDITIGCSAANTISPDADAASVL
ncbi:MAG TPA: site-2 protease family protein, partial [Bryobacteraceae bacterium]|nr:site-2 protease family protein [Bryobacteraceae bacterium]